MEKKAISAPEKNADARRSPISKDMLVTVLVPKKLLNPCAHISFAENIARCLEAVKVRDDPILEIQSGKNPAYWPLRFL